MRDLAGGGVVVSCGCRVWVPQARWPGGLKPLSSLLAGSCVEVKPPSPLRALKGHFCAISTLQRCWRFQWGAQRGLQRCCRFQSCPVIACYARKSSPCFLRSHCGARKSSPSVLKMAQNRRFMACWAKFFAELLRNGPCWASFFAEVSLEGPCWASFFAEVSLEGPCWASFFAEVPLQALMVSVRMRVGSPCGRVSSARRNFACNSLQGISNVELRSLILCRFWLLVDASSAGIACEIVEVIPVSAVKRQDGW